MNDRQPWCWTGLKKFTETQDLHEKGHSGHELPAYTLSAGEYLVKVLEPLPLSPGCDAELANYWATFSAIDLRPLLEKKLGKKEELKLDALRSRCLQGTFPFSLAQKLLNEQNRIRVSKSDCLSQVAYDNSCNTLEYFNLHLIVQKLVGRLERPVPNIGRVQEDLAKSREEYLEQTRSFQVIRALLSEAWPGICSSTQNEHERCHAKVQLFMAVQHSLPVFHSKPAVDPIAHIQPVRAAGFLDQCLHRHR